MRHPGDPILAMSLRPRRTWRTVKSSMMSVLMLAAFVLIALPLAAIVWSLFSKGGLVGAVMLGLGRAMGETIAVALVIGSSLGQITLHALKPGNSMPAVIANEWGEADDLHKSALIALAVTLFVITIVVNLAANAIVQRSIARGRGK